MKKILLFAAVAVFGLSTINAQEDVMEKAKEGSFYVGANVGFSLISDNYYGGYYDDDNDEYGSFNFGVDLAYLFEVIDNLEIGGLVGYSQYIASGSYAYFNTDTSNYVYVDFEDASFIPLAASARYYFADHKFFGGLDLGVGINIAGDEGIFEGKISLSVKNSSQLNKVLISIQKVEGVKKVERVNTL